MHRFINNGEVSKKDQTKLALLVLPVPVQLELERENAATAGRDF
jgi:hypothetical protein